MTASGTTLLGADNKAGVAEIVAAAEYLVKHPEIPHGAIRVGFTPDEEVGNGTKYFDVKKIRRPLRLHDGRRDAGEIEMETFSADAMTVTFQGFNTHPGYAKGKMINAIKVAADFINASQETGSPPKRPTATKATSTRTSSRRRSSRPRSSSSFATSRRRGCESRRRFSRKLAHGDDRRSWPGAEVEFKVDESYRNMKRGAGQLSRRWSKTRARRSAAPG